MHLMSCRRPLPRLLCFQCKGFNINKKNEKCIKTISNGAVINNQLESLLITTENELRGHLFDRIHANLPMKFRLNHGYQKTVMEN